jgi:predicted nucleic acid-binding protein
VKYIIDACSLINLHNGQGLGLVLALARSSLEVGPIVIGETGKEIEEVLRASGKVTFLDDSAVPAAAYLSLLATHGLGEGETEALALAQHYGLTLCSDDRKARKVGQKLLGENRIVGSLRLMRWCVEEDLCKCTRAYETSVAMRDHGGFVPALPQEFFCETVKDC